MSHRSVVPFLIGLLFACGGALGAQGQARYELGRRLAAMERCWEVGKAEDKGRALPHLQAAVKSFFGLRFSAAGKELDAARLVMQGLGLQGPSAWAARFALEPEWRLGATYPEQGKLSFRVRAFYAGSAPEPDGVLAVASLRSGMGDVLVGGEPVELSDEMEFTGALPLEGVPPGDHALHVDLLIDGSLIGGLEVGVSLCRKLDQRLEQLVAANQTQEASQALESHTARKRLAGLQELRSGGVLELDLPAARLLAEQEALLETSGDRPFYAWQHPGEYWLEVPLEAGTKSLRLLSPACAEGALRPCVIALHGAGGSENLFFEGYGVGAAVRMAQERGWVLIAPRAGFFGSVEVEGLLDALGGRYLIDRERVVLIGHSMGAAQALAVARKNPNGFRALAAIGGGGSSRRDASLAGLPVYVAAGSLDFGLSGARRLHASLVAAQGQVRLDIRQGIEHLTIVQEALPAVFRFFDEVMGPTESASEAKSAGRDM